MADRNKISVYLTDKTLELLRLHRPNGMSLSKIINHVIVKHLTKKKKRVNDSDKI